MPSWAYTVILALTTLFSLFCLCLTPPESYVTLPIFLLTLRDFIKVLLSYCKWLTLNHTTSQSVVKDWQTTFSKCLIWQQLLPLHKQMVPKAPVSYCVLLYYSKGFLSPRFSYITLFKISPLCTVTTFILKPFCIYITEKSVF